MGLNATNGSSFSRLPRACFAMLCWALHVHCTLLCMYVIIVCLHVYIQYLKTDYGTMCEVLEPVIPAKAKVSVHMLDW